MIELLALIVSTSLGVLLGLFVLLKNTKSDTNRAFFFLTTVLAAWSITNYISVHPIGLSQLWWARLVLFFAALLNLAVFLTFDVFPLHKAFGNPRWRRIAVAMTVLAMVVVLTPLVFVRLQDGNPVVAPGIVIFLLQTVLLIAAAVTKLIRKYARAHGIEKQQFKYVLLGLSATFGVILLTNFVLVVFAHTTAFLPFGATYTLFFTGAFAYAIVRHHLLDIRALVARSVAYVLLLVALGVIYGFAIFGITNIFFNGQVQSTTQEVIYAALAVVLAFTFQPLQRFFEQVTNRVFFRDHYESQAVLSELSSLLITKLTLDDLLQASLKQLCERLHIQSGQFYIFDEGKIYKVKHHGLIPHKLLIGASLQQLTKSLLVADSLDRGTAKEIMNDHGVRVSLRLHTHDQFVGFLILGDKLSGDVYSSQDLELLQIATKEIAVAVANAKAYEEIAHFNLTLQEKVDDATKRLRAANRHLKELDRAKDEFISMASHQLRTPLTSIKSYLSMLREGDAGAITKQQQEFLELAYNGSQRMINLVADLLNISRMSAGKFLIQKKLVDVAQLVEEETRQLQSRAADRGVQLTFTQPKRTLPSMELDEDKTRQVVMNFIDNAIYYAPHGKVKVQLDKAGNQVELRVIDNGIGVPPAAQAHLFNKFFRAGNAQNLRPDGTGLGLYLAKRVIEDQGGSVIFESTEGKGSTFGFAMPIKGKGSHGAH